jgi:hypothetical protein
MVNQIWWQEGIIKQSIPEISPIVFDQNPHIP